MKETRTPLSQENYRVPSMETKAFYTTQTYDMAIKCFDDCTKNDLVLAGPVDSDSRPSSLDKLLMLC